MTASKERRRVLIVSGGDKLYEYFSSLLPPGDFHPITKAGSVGEARRLLLQTGADIVIIDTPLPDGFGVDFALDIAGQSLGVMLVVKSELYERICYKVEDAGVLTVCKPNSRQMLYSSMRLLAALSARLQKSESKNRSLQEKMADIRVVNRAKWLLIERLGLSEADAHRLIEKRAMDERVPRRQVAEGIISSYEN